MGARTFALGVVQFYVLFSLEFFFLQQGMDGIRYVIDEFHGF